MSEDLLRHKLLKILSKQYIKSGQPENSSMQIGLEYEKVLSELCITREKLDHLTAELFLNKEIALWNTNGYLGIYANEIGVTSSSNNKYKKRYQDSILKIFKLFAQIIIPILSLLVAVFSLYTKFNSDNLERIELIEQKILLIEKNEKK